MGAHSSLAHWLRPSLFLQGSGTAAPWLDHATAWVWDPCPSYWDPQFQAACRAVAILTAHPRDSPTPRGS